MHGTTQHEKVWIVLYDCGDYYCEGHHIVEVCATEPSADHLISNIDQYWKEQGVKGKKYYTYSKGIYEVRGDL